MRYIRPGPDVLHTPKIETAHLSVSVLPDRLIIKVCFLQKHTSVNGLKKSLLLQLYFLVSVGLVFCTRQHGFTHFYQLNEGAAGSVPIFGVNGRDT